MMHKEPPYLWNKLSLQYYEEPRKHGLKRFSDSPKRKIGFQSLQNHVGCLKDIDGTWHGRKLTGDANHITAKEESV